MRTSPATSRFGSRRTAAAFIAVAAMAVAADGAVAAAAPPAGVQSSAAVTATQLARGAGLAPQRPIMGYDTWYQYSRGATEANVLTQARAMKSRGLEAAGYNLISLDDGWQGTTPAQRKAGVELTWNRAKFPHGIPWLAQQVHALGFKLGIYTAIGANTCFIRGYGAAGSLGYYQQDARLFASWGVSFVKIDDCGGLPPGTTDAQLIADYAQFDGYITADGMEASQEAPVFVAPADFTAAVAAASDSADQWRVTADEHTFQTAAQIILGHLDTDLPLARFAGPGHWNDLDMLVPGPVRAHRFGWTVLQEQSQLAVWSMEASPLILSTNVPTLNPAELAPLKNPDMIAVDQSGAQASRGGLTGYVRYLFKPADGGVAVLLANTGTSAAEVALPLDQVGLQSATAPVHDVFGGSWTAGSLQAVLAPGQARLFVLKPVG
ncbi:MAG TPA: glycoside hydrolase family 27 protein [Trebonia sp.]